MHNALLVGLQRHRATCLRALRALTLLPLTGCNEVATALVASLVAGFLLGCLLLLLGLLGMAILPIVRKPAADDTPDFHAPSAPSGLGVGSLVLSGMVAWAIFVPLGYTNAHALLGTHALTMFVAGAGLHLLTLAFALFAVARQPLDEEDAKSSQRVRTWGVVVAVLYGLLMFGLGLWPWMN